MPNSCCSPTLLYQDVILGKIYFLLVRIKIKFMELAVIRREAAGEFFLPSSPLSPLSPLLYLV